MGKQRPRRIGLGMKPREVSATAGQTEGLKEVEMEVVLGEPEGGDHKLSPVQNLESQPAEEAEEPIVAQMPVFEPPPAVPQEVLDTLADLMKKSQELTGATAERLDKLVEMVREERRGRPYPEDDGSKPSIAEIEKAIESGAKVEMAPNGDVTIQPAAPLGELPNGEYRSTVRIAEWCVEGVKGQAEADGISVEDWLTLRLTEHLEQWWAMPAAQ